MSLPRRGVLVGLLLAPLAACAGSERGDQGGVGEKIGPAADRPAARPGPAAERLPDVELAWLTRKGRVRLPELAGTPLVLNVWAQWCGPCREEAPHFQALHERAGDRLRVIGIDYEDEARSARAFVAELGLRYDQLSDPEGRVEEPFGLGAGIGLPATGYVTAQGRIVHIAHRPYRERADLLADVREHLGVRL